MWSAGHTLKSSGIFSPMLSIWLSWWLRLESVCLQWGRPGFNPWVGKIPWRRKWVPTPVLLPGKSHGWRSMVGHSPWGHKESDTTEQLHFHFSTCGTMEWNQFISEVLSRTNLARGKGQWSLLLILSASLRGTGCPLTSSSKERMAFETQVWGLERLPGCAPLPWSQAAHPPSPRSSQGNKCPLGVGKRGDGCHLAASKPRASPRWPSCQLPGWESWVGLFFTWTYCISFPSWSSHGSLRRMPAEGGGRVGWPWALGPSAPGVGSAAGFPGKHSCWWLCTRQALSHDSQQPPTPCPLGPGPAGFWRQCGLLSGPSCAQEDLVSPAGSAGGEKERQDAQVPGGRRLPMKAVWWHQVDCYCFLSLQIRPWSETVVQQ